MTIFHFTVDLRCHLANGDTQVVTRFRVPVEARTEREARSVLKDVATEAAHDEGSDLLDAPLEYLDIIRAQLS